MINTTIQVAEDLCWLLEKTDTKILGQVLPFSLGLHILRNQCHLLPGQKILLDLAGYDQSYAIAQVASHMGASVTVSCHSDWERNLFSDLQGVEIAKDDSPQDGGEYVFDIVVTNKLTQLCTISPDVLRVSRVILFFEKTAGTDFRALQGLVDQGISITCIESPSTAKADPRMIAEYVQQVYIMGGSDLYFRHTDMIFDMLRSKAWRPIPAKSSAMSHFNEAVSSISSPDGPHRAIVRCNPGTLLPTYAPPEPLKFQADASYILVGCLGGLGRVIT